MSNKAAVIAAIKVSYYPYNTMEAFDVGYSNYLIGNAMGGEQLYPNGVDQQAYDRGCEAAMRVRKFERAERAKKLAV
jgi:hypothetical protein